MARKKQKSPTSPEGFRLEHTLELWESTLPTGFLWHPDGETFVCLSEHELFFGDYAGGCFSHSRSFEQELWSFALSPDEETLALGTRDNSVLVVDYYSGDILRQMSGDRPEFMQAVAWAPDGHLVATLSDALRIWDSRTAALKRSFKIRREKALNLAWSPDGGRIAWATDQVHIRDVRTGEAWYDLDMEELKGASSVAWSPAGDKLAIACIDPLRVFLWDLENADLSMLLQEAIDGTSGLHFSPDARLLAANTWEHLWLWCVEDSSLFASLETGFVALGDVFGFHPTEPVFAVPAPSEQLVNSIQIWRFDDARIPGKPFISNIELTEVFGEESALGESPVSGPTARPDVFLSYAREDRAAAEKIAEVLKAQGWEVWWDIEDLRGGEGFRDAIDSALSAAACVVVIWSKNSVRSSWVVDEAETGRETGKLVPIIIDDCRPPLGMRGLHTRDLSEWEPSAQSDEFRGLLSDIHHHLRTSSVGEITQRVATETVSDIDENLSTVDPDSEPEDAREQIRLAWYFRDIKEDRAGYFKWLRRAAEQGLAEAQCELGIAYLDGGEDLRKNKNLAKKWLQASAKQGIEFAQALLDDL